MKGVIKDFLRRLLHTVTAYLLGQERERKKQSEAARDLEKQMEDIAAGPDVDRDELYQRMRDRNRGVPKVPGPSDGSD